MASDDRKRLAIPNARNLLSPFHDRKGRGNAVTTLIHPTPKRIHIVIDTSVLNTGGIS
jgi:hypothetical protein